MTIKNFTAAAMIVGLFSMGAFAQNALPTKSAASAPVPAVTQTVKNANIPVPLDKERLAGDKLSGASAALPQPTLEQFKANTEKYKKELAAREAAREVAREAAKETKSAASPK